MKSIFCINFPIELITHLKLEYPDYYQLFHFQNKFTDYQHCSVLILPVEQFITFHKQISPIPAIPYGSKEFLKDAFLLGAEDYLKDSWDCGELIIRVDKILNLKQLCIPGYNIEINFKVMKVNGKAVSLTKRETQIMYLLYKNFNSIVEYESFRKYLDMESQHYEQSLYVTFSMLKKKLNNYLPELFPDKIAIRNISSMGYQLKFPCG
ncbi:MAG: hypothetical protein B6241_08490 [Spirochaetaceae bacterium 4572_59]|nr:MAG: hypothetical protein B6241_08490 [Spirochaetaceae bacterium 4572_59]